VPQVTWAPWWASAVSAVSLLSAARVLTVPVPDDPMRSGLFRLPAAARRLSVAPGGRIGSCCGRRNESSSLLTRTMG